MQDGKMVKWYRDSVQNFGDGGWVMGRKVSAAVITGAVAAAMASHYATQSNDGVDIAIA